MVFVDVSIMVLFYTVRVRGEVIRRSPKVNMSLVPTTLRNTTPRGRFRRGLGGSEHLRVIQGWYDRKDQLRCFE